MEEKEAEKSKGNKHGYFDALRLHHYVAYDTDLKNVKTKPSNYFLENPCPISKPNLPFTNYFDELLKKKREFLTQIESFKKDFRKDKRKIADANAKCVNHGVYPQYVLDICGGRVKEPDIDFPDNCGYNWYYTGGVLDFITLGDNDYIITPGRVNQLLVTKPNDFGFSGSLDAYFNEEDPIYGIKSNLVSNDSVLVTARQKHRLSLILANFTYQNDPCSYLQFKIRSKDAPYCDATLNKNLALMFTLTTNGFTETVDITTGKRIRENSFAINDYFGQIACINNNRFIFNNRSELVIIDNSLLEKKRIGLKDNLCDDICSFTYKDDNIIYVATKHHLIKYDLRNTEPVESYAHMLESEPYLISSVKVGTTDVVCLANQKSKVVIECDDSKGSLALLLPNIMDTYDRMQVEEKVHIYRNLEQRLLSPTIGMKLTKNKEDVMTLFSLTAAGDIYQQKLSTERLNQQSEKMLSKWIDASPRVKTKLILTEVEDMSDARFALNKLLNKNKLATLTSKHETTLKSKKRIYNDDNYLGNHLEQIWLDDEDIVDEEDIPEIDTSQKVSAWLSAQKDF